MPHHADFLKEIIANPDDDVPRLVYADWLDEQGDPRGEFIRVQCALAGLPWDDDRRWALHTRETLLRRQFAKGWAGPLRHLVSDWGFRRGFAERITIRADRFLEYAHTLFQSAPINAVRLLEPENQLSALAASPWLDRIQSLDLRHTRLDPHTFGELAYSPAMIHLKELNLRGTEMCDAQGAKMIADCEYLRNLTALDLSSPIVLPVALPFHLFGDRPIVALAESPYLKNLTSLHLSGYGGGGGGMIAALADSPLLGRLTALDLSHNGNYVHQPGGENPADSALARLFQSPRAANLRHLTLIRNQIWASVEAFAQSPYLQNLQSLRIGGSWLESRARSGVEAMLESPNLNNLVTLDLSGCEMNLGVFRALFESDQFHSLRELNLNETRISDRGISALAESALLVNLRCLRLQCSSTQNKKCHFTARGLKELANSPLCQNLAVLDVGNQPIGEGVKALANSEHLGRLAALGLWKTRLTDEEARLLCETKSLPSLELLDVRSNEFSPETKSQLRECYGAGVQYGPA